MRKKRLLVRMTILLIMLSLCIFTNAQTKTITGKVTDSKDGTPVQGVSVVPKGSNRGVVTAADGTFRISVNNKITTLVFSSVNFTTQQVSITGSDVSVSLVASNSSLSEVVVIGYGTARKKDLTGSISVVSEKDFQKGLITTPDQMIAGKVAGVSVISNSGAPGAGSTIRIRGGTSINASNDPLIVIDGVPLAPEYSGGGSSIAGTANPLSMINSDDIESFTVLKDASATAIYGSRASNGVIIITTKKGRSSGLEMT